MRIVITGGTGFLGQRLTARLAHVMPQASVTALSRATDLRDAQQAQQVFVDLHPDLVFHLAAVVGGIAANARSPGTFFRDNMQIGLNVLEAARQCEVRKLVVAGTVCAYPKHVTVPFSENDLWNGYPEETNAPYGVAKRALAVMAKAYRREFGCNFVTTLIANLYGAGDNFDLERSHVIPGMIRRFVEAKEHDEPVKLWGDGSPSREFLYVEDAADGLIAVADKYDDPDPINIGTGIETRISDLAIQIAEIVGYRGEIVWDILRPNGQPRRSLDVSRAKNLLGFVAETPLGVGLEATVEWYLENRETR